MKYEPTWNSLKKHKTPEWFDDAKFGIYYHWGIYSVPACGPNVSWYGSNMYSHGTPQNEFHIKNYGDPTEFGYKDLIPKFTAEKFDPDAWAQVFKDAGAKFAGPVVIHHDSFAMWDSKITKWNAANMGPKRDTVGEMEKAIRKQGMKFFTAFHHSANWFFFPRHNPKFDTNKKEYEGLYGPYLGKNQNKVMDLISAKAMDQWRYKPNKEFCDRWKALTFEVIDNYKPDLIWWDFGLGMIPDKYKREVMAYYFNQAEEWNAEVEVLYKTNNLPPGFAVVDYEVGRANKKTYYKWISDTTVDKTDTWGYAIGAGVKSARILVHNLIDRVAKHGSLVLNVGPKSDGTLADLQVQRILEMGEWLKINGEAIYGTTPWTIGEEGPTQLGAGGMFSERTDRPYTPKDIRFTTKENILYAIVLGWPYLPKWIITSLRKTLENVDYRNAKNFYLIGDDEIKSIRMLGVDRDLSWEVDNDGLHIEVPEKKPSFYAVTYKIQWS